MYGEKSVCDSAQAPSNMAWVRNYPYLCYSRIKSVGFDHGEALDRLLIHAV